MEFFILMKIVCAVLIISTFANSEYTSTNTGNITENEDAAITSGVCGVWNTHCENGGTCVKQGNSSHCTCKDGTSGDLCEIVDECENRLCGNSSDAKCYFDVLEGKAVCKCSDENSIFDHERKTCRRECDGRYNCTNGGSCKMVEDVRICVCPEGTSGDFCEIISSCKNITFCGYDKNAVCYYDELNNTAACMCKDKKTYFDKYRRTCRRECDERYTCTNGGSCKMVEGRKICVCPEGTSGDLCEIISSCKNSTFCGYDKNAVCYYDELNKTAACMCKDKKTYFDEYTRTCRSVCGEGKHACSNGGTCSTYGQYSFCSCPNGTSGDFCQIVDECNKRSNLCAHRSTRECYFDEVIGKAACRCGFKTQIFDPVTKVCQWPCDPVHNICDNGGSCERHGNYMFCSCLNGTYGDFCEKIRDCEDPFFCGRSLSASCYFDESKEATACKCTDGKFYYREKKICISECDERHTCRNGGSCRMVEDARICFCPEGTSGDFCEIIATCKNSTFCGYDKNAECYYDGLNKTAACRCKDKKTYFDKYRRSCRKHCNGWTNGEQCQNGGECSVSKNKSFCICMLGTSGDLCETVDDCKYGNLCGNSKDVECYFNPVKRNAACRCRFDGAVYDPKRKICTSDCDRNPCHNGGTCSINNKKVKCACKLPYSGDNCESDARKNLIAVIMIYSVLTTGILVSIVTSCCALKSVQKVQKILEKTNGV